MTTSSSKTCLKVNFLLAGFVGLAALTSAPKTALAQDFTAMINQQMAQMNDNLAMGQQQIDGWVQQKMQDPSVQAGYQEYQARAAQAGAQPQSLYEYAYNWIYTNGYSQQGIAQARANEANNAARVQSAVADLRVAEGARGQAQVDMQQHFSNNQSEFGNALVGTSTFHAADGYTTVLPHTWQANTYQQYQGQQYYVDQGGNYNVLGSDGYWYPLSR